MRLICKEVHSDDVVFYIGITTDEMLKTIEKDYELTFRNGDEFIVRRREGSLATALPYTFVGVRLDGDNE